MLTTMIFILGIIYFIKLILNAATMMAAGMIFVFGMMCLFVLLFNPYIFLGAMIILVLLGLSDNKKPEELSA